MSDRDDSTFHRLPERQLLLVNRLCNLFEAKWKRGEETLVEEFLNEVSSEDRAAVLSELLPLEIEYRASTGSRLPMEEYLRRFPGIDRTWLSELLASTDITDETTAPDETTMPEKLGDYRVLCRIGGGGMGTVYKALHERMGRVVALKVLRAKIQRDPALLKRFDREVRVAARLSHPNIVAALDAREQAGVHFLITEYIEGIDLDALVRQSGPLAVWEAVDCILQAARGLSYAHEQGVIHRDIKPANLLRDPQGQVKVLDMGLARLDTAPDSTSSELTATGMVMGTAAYMAPEQARDTSRADGRSDIYSLGCTLYFLVNGRSMFSGESMIDTLLSQVSQPAPSLQDSNRDVPLELEQIFRRMVAKQPAERYQSVAELINALESLPKELLTTKVADHTALQTNAPSIDQHTDFTGFAIRELPETQIAKPVRQASVSSPLTKRLLIGATLAVALVGVAIYASLDGGKVAPMPKSVPQALRFNGHSSYVEVSGLVPTAGSAYTLEAIVEPRNVRTSNVISWLGPDWMALFLSHEGQWGVARRLGGVPLLFQAKQTVALNKTVHLAAVFDSEELQLFINGELAGVDKFEFELPETAGGLFIGGTRPDLLPSGQNDRFFDGDIDAVRISRGRRYTARFTAPAELAADKETIAVFPFEEGKGSTTLGAGTQKWQGRIVDAEWQPLVPRP